MSALQKDGLRRAFASSPDQVLQTRVCPHLESTRPITLVPFICTGLLSTLLVTALCHPYLPIDALYIGAFMIMVVLTPTWKNRPPWLATGLLVGSRGSEEVFPQVVGPFTVPGLWAGKSLGGLRLSVQAKVGRPAAAPGLLAPGSRASWATDRLGPWRAICLFSVCPG